MNRFQAEDVMMVAAAVIMVVVVVYSLFLDTQRTQLKIECIQAGNSAEACRKLENGP